MATQIYKSITKTSSLTTYHIQAMDMDLKDMFVRQFAFIGHRHWSKK